MVGVAGKSPACHNCRRRRVKACFHTSRTHSVAAGLTGEAQCSGEKPGCRNCIRAKLLCTGYQRERVFVFSKHSDPESAPGEDKAVSISKANEPAGRPGVSGPALRRAPVSTVRPVPTVPLAISGRHAYRQQLLGRYLCHYLPAEVVEHGGRPNTKQRNWLLYIPDLPDMSPALEAAVLASCAAKLGHMDRHRGLERESVSQYNKSLAELQKALRHPALRFQDQTLTACLALLMFEFSECPGGQVGGYLSHYWGAMELMHRRGAWAHASGLSNSVFRSLRLHSVSEFGTSPSPVPVPLLCPASRGVLLSPWLTESLFLSLGLTEPHPPRSSEGFSKENRPSWPSQTGWSCPGPFRRAIPTTN